MQLIELMGASDTEMLEINRQANLNASTEISGITCDSRLVEPGFLFAALPGTVIDGGEYIDDAIKRGASAILAPVGIDGKKLAGDVQLLLHPNPRKQFSKMVARFNPGQPEIIAAITGTNGKTSVAFFLEQIWSSQGIKAASLGTLGIYTSNDNLKNINAPGSHTTPDPVKLHQTLANLANLGVSNLVVEASSHGLDQYRLDGVGIKYGAFTNISREHLDYHSSMESYMAAKLRLFTELLDADGIAVINVDRPEGIEVEAKCKARGLKTIAVGKNGHDIRILEVVPKNAGQQVKIEISGKVFEINLPLVGSFQTENAIVALGLALASGIDIADCVDALEHLSGVPGRMQAVGASDKKIVFVDYAHTPDALETVLKNLRPHTKNNLVVVFGAGGDRDTGKRSKMGSVSATYADRVIVTDDNPRHENPAAIRAEILKSVPGAIEIADRHQAIFHAIDELKTGDILLIAGKGHEQGQIIGDETIPFDDVLEAEKAIAGGTP